MIRPDTGRQLSLLNAAVVVVLRSDRLGCARATGSAACIDRPQPPLDRGRQMAGATGSFYAVSPAAAARLW
jgi:hypothetical protein